MKNVTYDYVVLGAGVAGLTFAWKMSLEGKSVLVLEKETEVGGLARTIRHKGFLMDFCGHRFHTNNQEVLDTVLNLPGLTMRKIKKKTRIYMFDKYLKYPFELPNLLRAMPVVQAMTCCIDFALNAVKQRIHPILVITYKDWFVKLYGNQLYTVMCEPYTSKIWRMDPAAISSDWADQRFGGPNLIALMKKSIQKIMRLDFSSYTLEDDSLAPDGGDFYYPEKGFQELPDAFADGAKRHGANILSGVTVEHIHTKKRTVTYRSNKESHTVSYRHLISTIPLSIFYQLQERKNQAVEQAFKKIRYMDIIFVYVFLRIPQISNDHWIYFPDPKIPFNRSVEFSNWSKYMAPKGKTCVCFDITCFSGDETWQQSDAVVAKRSVEEAVRVGYFKEKDVLGTHVTRVRFAYPVYDVGYRKRLEKIVRFLESPNISLLGRTGIFRYNNSDNSIEMALELAKRLLAEDKDPSLLNYQIQNVSL